MPRGSRGPRTGEVSVHGQNIILAQRRLKQKFARDKDVIRSTWLSLPVKKRTEMILESVNGGAEAFPQDENDRRFGYATVLTPEMNVKNLVTGDNLLQLMELRATTPVQQIHPYDLELVRMAMLRHGIQLRAAGNGVYLFVDEDKWGQLMEFTSKAPRDQREKMLEMGRHVAIVDESDGKMVLERQVKIYPHLEILVDDIMEVRRELDNPDVDTWTAPRSLDDGLLADSVRELVVGSPAGPKKHQDISKTTGIEDIKSMAEEQFGAMDDHVKLLTQNPNYLSSVARNYFFSSPDAVPGGPAVDMMSSSYASEVVLELFTNACEASAHWKYISALVAALEGQNASYKVLGNPLLTELWATTLKEHGRSRAIFKRMLQTDYKSGKFFERNKEGHVRLKVPHDIIAKKNPYMGLLTELATMSDASASGKETDIETARILTSLHDMEDLAPRNRENILEHVGIALGDIAVITVFMSKLRNLIKIPKQSSSLFSKDMQARLHDLEHDVWKGIDLLDYACPVDRLRDKSAADGCVNELNKACQHSLKVGLDKMFDAVVESALSKTLARMEDHELEAINKRCNLHIPPDTFIGDQTSTPEAIPERPREKVKTRGQPAAEYLIQDVVSMQSPKSETAEKIPVAANVSKTFKQLFSDGLGRSGIPWSSLLSAMARVGFAIEPVGGSVYRFCPGEQWKDRWAPINIHRPHPGDRVDGLSLIRLAGRLHRRFGWGKDTFVSGKGKK